MPHIYVCSSSKPIDTNLSNPTTSIETLNQLGYDVTLSSHALDNWGNISSPITTRVSDLQEGFINPQYDVVMASVGGWCSNEILPHIDYKLIARYPKPFIGMSDITTLCWNLWQKANIPTIYGLNLRHFAEGIRSRDLAAMRKYAETCVRMQHANTNAFGAPIITFALVQGDALGGGFEHALAFDVLVAEKSARLGLPEIVFNLFPGMGAYSFLIRRVGRKLAEKFILEGKIHTAEELYDIGIVDVLVPDGEGEAAIVDYCTRYKQRFAAERAVYLARRASNPVELDELLRITNVWAETAMTLTDADVRKMERLADAQERRINRSLKRAE